MWACMETLERVRRPHPLSTDDVHETNTLPTRAMTSKRASSRFIAASLLSLAGAVFQPADGAEDDAPGWFSRISDLLFKKSDNPPVNVPLRRRPTPPPPDAPALGASDSGTSAQPDPPASPAEVAGSRAAAEPSDAYSAVQDLIGEITVLREELGARDHPPEAELIEARAPVHVYAKTREVLAKVTDAQRRLGVPVGVVGRMPLEEIDATDVLANIRYTLDELRKIKTHMGIARQIVPAPPGPGTTASIIYKGLADASFLLDAVRGHPLTPDDVHRNAMAVLDEIVIIATRFDVAPELQPEVVEGEKKQIDVARQILRATYKVINLQSRLDMEASIVPAISLVRVTPSETYDAINVLLAELVRVKLHLGIDIAPDPRPDSPTGKSSNDCFAVAALIVRNLNKVSRAIAS